MRRMRNCWPSCRGTEAGSTHDDGIDCSTPIKAWKLGDGDLFVMRGKTQDHWHHRVPKEKARRPRININFRMILPNQKETEGGQRKYYKYMVHGDNSRPPSWTYHQLLRKKNSLLGMLGSATGGASTDNDEKNCGINQAAKERLSNSLDEWQCPKCTLLNGAEITVCGVCGHQLNKRMSADGNKTGCSKKKTKVNTIISMFRK